MATGSFRRGWRTLSLLSLALLVGTLCPGTALAQYSPEVIEGLLERYSGQLAEAGLLNRFGRGSDAAEKTTVSLSDAESARLAAVTESFYRELAANQQGMQELMRFKNETMTAHQTPGENPLFPGQQHWDRTYLSVERALMMGRAQMVQVVWRQSLIDFYNADPNNVALVYGEIDIGSWVKMTLKGLDFKADIDFSSLSTLATANTELYRTFCENFAARTDYTPAEVQRQMDAVLTRHGRAGIEVFIGRWGQAFAEMDMLKRSNWKQINAVRDASGRVTDVTFKVKSGQQLFWETAFKTGQEVQFPKIVAEHEPMISLEMLRHLVHDIEHSTSFSRGEKIIKLLKYVERSYFMNKKATAASDWNPYEMNDPQFAKLADDVIKIKGDSKLTPQEAQERIAQELAKFSEGKLAEGTVDEFVRNITEQAKKAISANAEAGLGNRLKTIAATPDEFRAQLDLERLWTQMSREIGALNDSGQTPPENVVRLLDLAMAIREGGAAGLYATKVIEFQNLLTDVYRLPTAVVDTLMSFESVARLRDYCRGKLKWSSENIDKFVKQVRQRYPKVSSFYDGFVEFNEKCNETASGSVLLEASQWVDMGFTVYEAYMQAPDKDAGFRAAAEQLATLSIQYKWPLAGIPVSVYTSLSQGSPKPLVWAVAFYYFPGVAQIYTVSVNMQRFDVLYREKAFYDELGKMLECTEFDQDGKIIQFKLLGPGGAVRAKADVSPPGNRDRIVEIFEQDGSPFAASSNFNYWRLLIPDKQFEPFSYVTRLGRLRQYFPYSDEIRFWTVMLENQEARQLPDDRYNIKRLEALDQFNEKLRAAIWMAMADALEAGVRASDDRKVAEWKKKIKELEDDLGLSDAVVGRNKGLQSRIDREITVATGKVTQVWQGDNFYAAGMIYDKYINAYERVRRLKNDVFKTWQDFQVDGARIQTTPLKLLLNGGATISAPPLNGELQRDLMVTERCLLGHQSRKTNIRADLTRALRRSPDPATDAEHLKILGQLAFEWEHLLDDTPDRDGVLSEPATIAQMSTRRKAYQEYLLLLGIGGSLRVEGATDAKVDEPVPLKAVVEVSDSAVKSWLKFSWSEGKVALGQTESIKFLSKIKGPHELKVALSYDFQAKKMLLGEADHRIVVGGLQNISVKVLAPTGAKLDERVNLKAAVQADKTILPRLRCVWFDGQAALGEGESIWFASRVTGPHKLKVEVRARLQDKEEKVAEGTHELVVGSDLVKAGTVTASLEGLAAAVTQNASVQISARDFRLGQKPFLTEDTSSTAPKLQAKWCANWELTHRNEVEEAKQAGKTLSQICPPRPAGWGIDAFQVAWYSRPALAFTPKETANEGSTSLAVSAANGTSVTVWGEIRRKAGSMYLLVGETERKTFTIGKSSTLQVKIEAAKTTLKPGETVQVLVTVTDPQAKPPLKFAWTGSQAKANTDGSKVTFVSRKGGQHVLGVEVTDAAGLKGTASVTLTVLSVTATLEGLTGPVIYGTTRALSTKVVGLENVLETSTQKPPETNKGLWVLTRIERRDDPSSSSDAELRVTCEKGGGATVVITWTAPPAKARPGEVAPLSYSCSAGSRYVYGGLRFTYYPDASSNETGYSGVLGDTTYEKSGIHKFTFPEGIPGKSFAIYFGAYARAGLEVQGSSPCGGKQRTFVYTYEGAETATGVQDVKVIWQSEPGITFTPPTSLDQKTTALFDRMGAVRIWAEVQVPKGPVWETVAETEQQEVEVVAPKFTLVYQPPEGKGKIGQEVRAKIATDPPLPAALLDFVWTNPGSTNRTHYEQNAGTIGFKPKDTKPLELLATACTPKGLETISEIKGSYVVTPYTVRAEVVGTTGLVPQVWQEGKGLVNVPQGTYAADQQVRVRATLEGTPKPTDVRWNWTVNEGTSLVGGQTSAEATVSRHETGAAECSVEARDKDGVLLGRGSTSFSVTVSAADLSRAREKSRAGVKPPTPTPPDNGLKAQAAAAARKVEELLKQGKTHEAAAALQDVIKLDPVLAAPLGDKIGAEAKKQGWQSLQKWDFDPALKNLALAGRLLPADADAQSKLTHTQKCLVQWNEENLLATEFEELVRAKKWYSAYAVLVRIDRIENGMVGEAPAGESPLKARLNRINNEANKEFNEFLANYNARLKEADDAKDWETGIKLIRGALERELGPFERDARAALAAHERLLADQQEVWKYYLTAKAAYERGEYSMPNRALAMSNELRGRLSRFAPSDPRYQEIEALAAALAAVAAAKPAASPTLRLAKTSYEPGEEIRVEFTASANYAPDAWIGIIPSNIPHGQEAVNDQHELTYQFLSKRASGVLIFKAPQAPGSYDLRMNDADTNGREVASISLTVISGSTTSGGKSCDSPLDGAWQLDQNGHIGRIEFSRAGGGWTGRVYFDEYRKWEPLTDVKFDVTQCRLTFFRPEAKQPHDATVTNSRIEGTFQSGGGTYGWKATRPGSGGGTGNPPQPSPVQPQPPVPTPPTAQGASLRLQKTSFAPGEEIRVQFTASADFPRDAWVGLIPSYFPHGSEAENDKHELTYQYLEKRSSGVLVFTAPRPGNFDLRMNDTDSNGREVASVSLTVGCAPVPAAAAGASLRLEKSNFAPGEEIRVHFTAPASYHETAWVGILPCEIPHGSETTNDQHELTYQYLQKRTSGILVFKAPSGSDTYVYDFRMHDTDTDGREVASVSFTIGQGESVPAPTSPIAGQPSTPSPAEPAAGFLAGNWDYVWDRTMDGKMVPEEAPYPVVITAAGGNRFTAKYGTGLYGSYTGQLLTQNGRTVVRMHYIDSPRSYVAEFEAILVDKNTIEGRYEDNKGGRYEFRWTRVGSR